MGAKRKLPSPVAYLRAIGIGGVLLGIGGAMFTTPVLFWGATSFVYAGLFALIIDAWYEPNLKKSPWMHWSFFVVVIVFAAFFTFGIAFYDAPLAIASTSFEGLYKNGESVYGIIWNDDMSDLRIDIHNPTTRDYDHLDAIFTMNWPLMIRDQRQITNIPGVSLLPLNRKMHVRRTDEHGKVVVEENLPDSSLSADQLRVLCDRLPKNTTIGLILAVSEPNPVMVKNLPRQNGVLVESQDSGIIRWFVRARPTKISTTGSYSVLNRPYEIKQEYKVMFQ
jgi:hypothetical protein